MMKIWLDDVRPAPEGYTKHFITAEELILYLKSNVSRTKYLLLDLDHDLGEAKQTGLSVLNWIEERCHNDTAYTPPETAIHTDNAAVYSKMKMLSDKLNKLRKNRIFYLECYGR